MDENLVKTRQALEAQLIDRAMQDEGFRQELVRDPKAVFERELGIQMSEHITMQVLEESPTTVYLVLPQPPASAGVELADEELEGVAGGTGACTGMYCYTDEIIHGGTCGHPCRDLF